LVQASAWFKISCGLPKDWKHVDTEKWNVLSEVELLVIDGRIRVSNQLVQLPDGRQIENFLRLESTPTAVVLALTEQGDILCERQYKHGVGRKVLTLVGGRIEPGERSQDAAKRELLEETGYESDEWQFLGESVTHANAGGTTFYSFLARNCRKVTEPNSGDLEAMKIEIRSFRDVFASFANGESPLAGDATTLLNGAIALGFLPTKLDRRD
jgi:ADP-ribose pyrophosphatase